LGENPIREPTLARDNPDLYRLRLWWWCNFPVFERRIVDVKSHRGMVSENRSK